MSQTQEIQSPSAPSKHTIGTNPTTAEVLDDLNDGANDSNDAGAKFSALAITDQSSIIAPPDNHTLPSQNSSCSKDLKPTTDAGERKRIVKVYIVRHGETASNAAGIIQGQLNTALNEAGVKQAKVIAEALRPRNQKAHDAASKESKEPSSALKWIMKAKEQGAGKPGNHTVPELKASPGGFVYGEGRGIRFDYAFTSDLDRARDVSTRPIQDHIPAAVSFFIRNHRPSHPCSHA